MFSLDQAANCGRVAQKTYWRVTQERIGPQLERTTFEDLATIKIDYDVNARRTKSRMLTSLKGLRAHFGMYLAKDITFDRLNAFIAHRLKEGMSPASVRIDLFEENEFRLLLQQLPEEL